MRYNFNKQTFDILRSQEAERENKSEKNKDKIISGLRGRITHLNLVLVKRVKWSNK